MADLPIASKGLQIFLQKKSGRRLNNNLFNKSPLLTGITGWNGKRNGEFGLGAPDSKGLIAGGVNTPKARKEEMMRALKYKPMIQAVKPDITDGRAYSTYGTTPVRSDGANKTTSGMFRQPEFGFHGWKTPYQVTNFEMLAIGNGTDDQAEATKAIGGIMDAEVKTSEAIHLEYWNRAIWGTLPTTVSTINGTGMPTDQSAPVWDQLFSVREALKEDNNYGGIDRSLPENAWWRGHYITSSVSMSIRDMIRMFNYESPYRFADTSDFGVDLIVLNNLAFEKALAEADGKSQFMITRSAGIPDRAEIGFKGDIITYDGKVQIMYDPEAPAGHVAALKRGTWTWAVHPAANFRISEPVDHSKEEGGTETTGGKIETLMMFCCEQPSQNAYLTNFG